MYRDLYEMKHLSAPCTERRNIVLARQKYRTSVTILRSKMLTSHERMIHEKGMGLNRARLDERVSDLPLLTRTDWSSSGGVRVPSLVDSALLSLLQLLTDLSQVFLGGLGSRNTITFVLVLVDWTILGL